MRTSLAVFVVCALGMAACGDGGKDTPTSCDAANPCPPGFICLISGGMGTCVPNPADGGTADARTVDAGPPPDTTIVTHPDNITTSTTGSFTFTSTPTGATFECSLDNSAFAACTTPDMLTGLTNGTHTFQVRGILNGGVDPTPASFTWRVDTAVPTVTGLACPEAEIGVSEVSIPFASEAGTTFACNLDGTTAVCMSPAHYSQLSQTAHAFSVVATDTAGNHSVPGTCNFTVTHISPETTIDCPGPVNTANLSVSFGAVPSGATFECAIGTGDFASCSSPQVFSGLADGTTKLQVRATAGGVLEPTAAECDIVVDTHAPTVTIVNGPANGDSTGTTVNFTYISDETNSTFVCTLDTMTAACDPTGVTYTDLLVGSTHHFAVVAKDAAGNASAPATRDFTVGNGPTVIITLTPTKGPADGAVVGPSGTITFTTLGGDTGIAYSGCSLDGAAVSPCSSPVPWANLVDGTMHEFDVTATNTTSSQSTMARRSFTVDAKGPVVTIVSPPDGLITGTDVFLTFTATDPSTPVTTICAVDGSPTLCSSGTPLELILQGGSRAFSITAEDAFGNKTIVSRQLEIDGTGPGVTVTAQPTVSCPSSSDGGFDDAFRFKSNDSGPVTFTCEIDGRAASDCTLDNTQGVKRWNDLSDGNHTIIITAFDEFGNPGPENLDRNGNVASIGVHITWLVDREPPTLTITTPPNNQSLETGVNGTMVFTAIDNPAMSGHAVVVLGCSIDGTIPCDDNHNVPVGNTYSNFGWHNLSDGAHTVNITAQDVCGPVNVIPGGVSNTWTVDAVGDTIAFAPFTNTNTSPTAGPTGVTTQGTGRVNWTLHNLRSNPANNTMAEPMPTPVTCVTSPSVLTGSCTCAAPNPLPGRAGEDWNCSSSFTSATDTDTTITLVYNDGAVPPNKSTPNPAQLTWHIDATAPTIVFDSSPGVPGCTGAGALVVSQSTGAVTFTSSDTLVSSNTETASTVHCTVTDITAATAAVDVACTPVPATAPAQYRYSFTGLTDGHHYRLTVVASDEVVNKRTATRDWVVDGSTPVITFQTPNATPGFTNVVSEPTGGGATTGAITTTDAFGATSTGITETCTIDGGTAFACGPTSYAIPALSEGNHTVAIAATDCVGHTANASLTFYVDQTAPSVTFNQGESSVNSSEVFTITAHDGGGSGTMTNIQTVSCTFDGATCPPLSNATALPTAAGQPVYTATLNLSELSAGPHSITVTAADHFGHSTTQNTAFTTHLVDANFGVFGHLVLIGQDFGSLGDTSQTNTTAVENFIGNAALASGASSFTRPLRVLIADFGSQDGTEVANIKTAICDRIEQHRRVTCGCSSGGETCVTFENLPFTANVSGATALEKAMVGEDVVVFSDVNDGTTATSAALAALAVNVVWTNLVTNLAGDGAVFIVTSGRVEGGAASPTYLLASGIIGSLAVTSDQGPWSAEGLCFDDEPLEAFFGSDVSPWPVETSPLPASSVAFIFDDSNAVPVFQQLPFVVGNMVHEFPIVFDRWFPTGNGPTTNSCGVIELR